MDARSTCEAIQRSADQKASAIEQTRAVAGIFNVFGNIAKAAGVADNNAVNEINTLINTKMTSEDVTKIVNTCGLSVDQHQANVIDNSRCKYCETNRCALSNIKQSNTANVQQSCVMQSIVDHLSKQTPSIDTLSTIAALQKANGGASNSTIASNCEEVNTDVSSSRYLETTNACHVQATTDQVNNILYCGDIQDVIQDNATNVFNQCMYDNNVTSRSVQDPSATATNETKTDQSATNNAGALSSVSCACCLISLICLAIAVVSGYASAFDF
ncbi:hypothetical protein GGF32_002714 [Allomyces javanicus]|nr:hypothetical protein GGF32_002714 [Allomyces javanicus]